MLFHLSSDKSGMETYIAQFWPFIKAKHKRYFFWNHRQVYVYILTKLKHMIVTNSSCLRRGGADLPKIFSNKKLKLQKSGFCAFLLAGFHFNFKMWCVPSTSTTQWKVYS